MNRILYFSAVAAVLISVLSLQAGTVAYWPMELDPATGGTSRMVRDRSGNGYGLGLDLSDQLLAATDVIPCVYPPNGPSDITISSCAEILDNSHAITTNAFIRGSRAQTQTADPLILALGLRHDFTVEGYLFVKSLKHGNGVDTIILFSGVNGSGDWIWNFTEPSLNSNTRQVTVVERTAEVNGSKVLCTIPDADIVGAWHHYALTFKFDDAANKSRWTFYIDGVQKGTVQVTQHAASQNVQHDRFCFGGGQSSSKKVLNAKFAFWRISDELLTPADFLCAPSGEPEDYHWTGAANGIWSVSGALNWELDETATYWYEGMNAIFRDVGGAVEVKYAVSPKRIEVDSAQNLTFDFGAVKDNYIARTCEGLVKKGSGTLTFTSTMNNAVNLMRSSGTVDVREGTFKVCAVNTKGAFGNAKLGFEVKVRDGATLWLDGRNAVGEADAANDNRSVFSVYTNGTFRMSLSDSGQLSIQSVGTLDLLGGEFIAPVTAHNIGYLQIRHRLTLGHRVDREPYVFPVVETQNRTYYGGITFGTNTEFRVEDITGDERADGVFNCAVLARGTSGNWNQYQCGFRKTGAGTMELNNTAYSGMPSVGDCLPNGEIAIEEGELKINNDYTNSGLHYTVSSGAYLSGTGQVSPVRFKNGAGIRYYASQTTHLLTIPSATIEGGGVIELFGVPFKTATEGINCARITGAVTGEANLSGWKLKLDGAVYSRAAVEIVDGYLRVTAPKQGLAIILH